MPEPSRIDAVTTFTKEGYEKHGRRFLDTFKFWRGVRLLCYTEPFLDLQLPDNAQEHDLERESPQLQKFKSDFPSSAARGILNGRYNYIWDAVKWSHRIFALAAGARISQADILINTDSDIITFSEMPQQFLIDLLGDADIAYMPRSRMYSECSFVLYRRSNPLVCDLIEDHEKFYTTGLIFQLKNGWTDCHAFDVLISSYTRKGLKTRNINAGVPESMHPFVNGPLGAYMDHVKGARKNEGRSRKSDFVVDRQEAYWLA